MTRMTPPKVYATPDAFSAIYLLQYARPAMRSCAGGWRGVILNPQANPVSDFLERIFDTTLPPIDPTIYECGHVHGDGQAALACACEALLAVSAMGQWMCHSARNAA